MNNHLNNCASLCTLLAASTITNIKENYPIVAKIPYDAWNLFVSVLAFRLFAEIIKHSNASAEEKKQVFLNNYSDLAKEYKSFEAVAEHLRIFEQEFGSDEKEFAFWLATNLFSKDAKGLSQEELQAGFITYKLIAAHVSSFIEN